MPPKMPPPERPLTCPGVNRRHLEPALWQGSRNRRQKMSKIKWLLAALGVALAGLVPVLGASAPAGADPPRS